jgi:hypothetical protein
MRVIRILMLLLVIALVLPSVALAGPPPDTWVTGIQVQNLDLTTAANVRIDFYAADGSGTAIHTLTYTIEPAKSKSWYVPNDIPQLPSGFIGSAVVSANVQVAAILNTAHQGAGTEGDPRRVGAAAGVLSPSTKVYAPYLRKNYYGYNSYMAIQNAANVPATVQVTYKAGGTGADLPAATQNFTLAAYTTRILYQNDNASLPDGFYGSAVISGTQQLAVVINNYGGLARGYMDSQFESYNGLVNTGATKLYLPKLTVNYYEYQSSFTVQNVGTAPAMMTVNYTFGTNTYSKASPAIQPGAAWSVYLPTSGASGLPAGFSGSGSAVITSDQPVVGLVAEVQPSVGFSVVSSAIPDGSGTTVVVFPKFDRRYYDFNAGVQIQNIGTAPTRVTLVFSQAGRADVTYTTPAPIDPGKSFSLYGPNVPGLTDNFSGSVGALALDGQPIAGVVTNRNDVLKGDSYTAYNGIQKS